MFNRLLLGLVFFLAFANSHAAIKATLNQTVVYEGDPVQLTIESDRKVADQPDLSVLDKDFVVQGTSEGTSFSMVNGNSSFSQTWTITLLPKHNGHSGNTGGSNGNKRELTVPAVQLGSESTLPIQLTVAEITPELQAKNREHVTLEAVVDIGQSLPYVQQQIPYTLKLYTDETVRQGDIFEPNIENAIIEQVSEGKQYGIVRNGKKLNVLERHYVISPEKSGNLVIPPAIFKGKRRIVSKDPRGSGSRRGAFDDFFNDPFFGNPLGDQGEPITTRSDSIEIAVQTIPDKYKGESWLPAEDLVIVDSWNKEVPVFRVGEPVERILVLQAKGLAGSQIPKYRVAEPDNMRTYHDKEKAQTKSDGTTVYGLLQQTVNYIPNAEGKIKIPAVKVDWWDVVAREQKTFTIAAREISVLPGVGGSKQKRTQPTATDADLATGEQQKELSSNSQEADEEKPVKNYGVLILIALLLGLLVTYLIYRYLKQKTGSGLKGFLGIKEGLNKVSDPRPSEHQILAQLQQACSRKDDKQIAKQLLQLAKNHWIQNPPESLGALAKRLASGGKLLKELDESLYAVRNEGHKGRESSFYSLVWDEFKQGLTPVEGNKSSTEDGFVESLYPTR